MERRKRNKPTKYDRDIHIRIHQDYVDKIKKEAKEKKITMTLLTRKIIEEHYEQIEKEN